MERFAALNTLLPGSGSALDCNDRTMLATARRFIEHFRASSPSLARFGAEASALFIRTDGADPVTRFLAGEEFASQLIPGFESLCEKMLVNHVFYEQFPFPFEDRGACAGAETLFAAASLLRVAATA